jgi:two-component system, OmpR family, KDP operon response regulator KdpE
MKRALVIDDEEQIRRLLRLSLEKKGWDVFEAAAGFEGIQAVRGVKPDLLLLDLNLPDRDGLSVLTELRQWSSVPVIVLSVRNSEEDIVSLLNAGADDYLVKPFNTNELMARMNVALRRRRPEPGSAVVKTGRLSVDLDSRSVKVEGSEVKLTPTEYAILSLLCMTPGRIVTQEKVLKEIWGPVAEVEAGNLRVYIGALRKKIEVQPSRPELLITEPGIGYRLVVLPEQEAKGENETRVE